MNKNSVVAAQVLAILLLVAGIAGVGISVTASIPQLLWIGLFFAALGLGLLLILLLSARPVRAMGWLILGVGIVAVVGGALDIAQDVLRFNPATLVTVGILYAALGISALLLDRFTTPASVPEVISDPPPKTTPVENPSPPLKRQDDFSQVAGIGPKRTQALNEIGIYTYAQLAKTPFDVLYQIVRIEEDVKVVGDAATWPRQARYLMSGDLKRLHDYQARLIDGRDPDVEGSG